MTKASMTPSEPRALEPFEGITDDFTMDGRGVITIIPSAPSTLVTGGLLAELRGILVMLRDAVGHPDNVAMGDRGLALIDAALATQPAESKACASVAKPLDDPRLQQAFGDAIEGALAFGFQGSNEPPAGHWLWRFWNIGHAEATKVPSADLLRAAQVALHEMCKVGCPGVDDLDEAITDAKAAALASPAPSVGEPANLKAVRAFLFKEYNQDATTPKKIARQRQIGALLDSFDRKPK